MKKITLSSGNTYYRMTPEELEKIYKKFNQEDIRNFLHKKRICVVSEKTFRTNKAKRIKINDCNIYLRK